MIDATKTSKSPGPDGLPNEYFKTFKLSPSPYLLDTSDQIIKDSQPPNEMLQATVITIPKPGKPTDIVSNYHPISLHNNDIKIFSKIIAN